MIPVRLDPAGWPFIGGAVVLAALSAVTVGAWLALVFLVLATFFAFFFVAVFFLATFFLAFFFFAMEGVSRHLQPGGS